MPKHCQSIHSAVCMDGYHSCGMDRLENHMKIYSPLHYGKQFAARLEMLFEEGLGPWIALIGVEFMILAIIYLNAPGA